MAAADDDTHFEGTTLMGYGYSILPILILILDIYVIYQIVISSASPGAKLLWVILVLFLPLIGPILYFLIGRGAAA